MAGVGGGSAVGSAGPAAAAAAVARPWLVRVQVRAATPADLPGMLPVWTAMMRAHANIDAAFDLAPEAERHWQAWVLELIHSPRAFVLVAQLGDGRTAGLAVGWVADNLPIYAQRQVGFLSELAVASWIRRRGVGTALLTACRRWFLARGASEFQLATAVGNQAAQAFWRSMGGVPMLTRFRMPTGLSPGP